MSNAPARRTDAPARRTDAPARRTDAAARRTDAAATADTIAVGDCIEQMQSWPAQSVDLIFADPPYNIGYKYDQYEDTRDDHDYVDWTCQWIDGCARLLKATGSLYILIGDEYAAETRMHLKKLERDRSLVFRNWIVWHYTFGQNCRAKFNRSHAHLFYCVGPAAFDKGAFNVKRTVGSKVSLPFTFNRELVAVPSARQTTYADRRANPCGKLPDDTWYLRPQEAIEGRDAGAGLGPDAQHADLFTPHDNGDGDSDGASAEHGEQNAASDAPWYFDADGDTWYLSRLCGTFKERQGWHPCQLPEALLERIIKVSSNEGDLVFDPFVGSGTTLAVAARLGRRWLGCEMSKEYASKALERVRHVEQTGQKLLSTCADKGIEKGKPKKKAEPHRSTRAELERHAAVPRDR